jgi:alpha-L-fucosidase
MAEGRGTTAPRSPVSVRRAGLQPRRRAGPKGPAYVRARPRVTSPSAIGPQPSARQLQWQELEFYGFLHFGINTFTDKEWGYGDESESLFDPTSLDARQWVRVARDAGMKGLVITAKHHDGFCLWPSRLTDHSVTRSPWKAGRGDVLRELADACREYGLKLGVYLSPWDRNHAAYGTPDYLAYYRSQLRELMTSYGPLFEVWFDGANGGDGYYGGARETRRIDGRTYYDWPATWSLVRSLQPGAVIFSDAGPDARWVGNEKGVAFETSWYGLDSGRTYPGDPTYARDFAHGRADASDWVPPEVDVSIRPGWFYHQAEDPKVKSVDDLMTIYEQSVGRGANLLLNVPPDRRGLISDADAERLRAFRRAVDAAFRVDLARTATVTATNVRGGLSAYGAGRVNDGRADTYWAADDGVTSASVTLAFPKPTTFERVVMQEFIALGQRIERWSVEVESEGSWRVVAEGSTIGRKRIVRCGPLVAGRIRVNILAARACPTLASVGVY